VRDETVIVRASASGEPGAQGVFAARDIAAGERIGTFTGTETATRTRMSLQFGPETHIEPGELDPLRFLNHACDPNAAFTYRELIARIAIPAGTEITLDYNRHEPELASPFHCHCEAQSCVGVVRGWMHLNSEERPPQSSRAW
jgi:hypothetical protein